MKLLVFAHTPPPHHGQSFMVKLMLDSLAESAPGDGVASEIPIECYHINCRFSNEMEDIGELQVGKIWLLLRYCFQAVWYRFRHGVKYFYYVPAPGKRLPLYRDWIIMLLCRPFFKAVIFHWHAVGMADWLQREGFWFEKFLTRHLLRHPDLSIVLAIPNMRDALWFETRRLEIIPNGIPDPCPDFDQNVLPYRQSRAEARAHRADVREPAIAAENAPDSVFRILYMAHCTRKKGIFDTLEATAQINLYQPLPSISSPGFPRQPRVHLTVAGAFLDPAEQKEFEQRILRDDLKDHVTYSGFVSGDTKTQLLRTSDCLCFPTYYEAEGQPVNLIEAMAFGLPVITTRWRAIPETLPPDYPFFVAPQSPEEIAKAIHLLFTSDYAAQMRRQFTGCFTAERHIQLMKNALMEVSAAT